MLRLAGLPDRLEFEATAQRSNPIDAGKRAADAWSE